MHTLHLSRRAALACSLAVLATTRPVRSVLPPGG